jgi:hypothetical protein
MELKETYKGYDIIASEEKRESGKHINWLLFKEGIFVLQDFRTIDGDNLQSAKHAINDAKKNVDTIIRLKLVA